MIRQIIRKYGKLIVGIFFLAAWGPGQVSGQSVLKNAAGEDGLAKMKELLTKIKKAYYQAPYLGFHVTYLYSNEGQLSGNTDSLAGIVQMDKGRCRVVIDGMETIITQKYAIQVMDENKAIYLSAAQHPGIIDPINTLDSVFAHSGGVKAEVKRQEGSDVVIMRFPPGQAYSSIEIRTDPRTGYFQRISYSLYTAGLVGQELIDRPGHPGPYRSKGKIDIVFSDYERSRFDDSLFSEENYFNKVSGHFVPSGRYKNYQIFLASSNL